MDGQRQRERQHTEPDRKREAQRGKQIKHIYQDII